MKKIKNKLLSIIFISFGIFFIKTNTVFADYSTHLFREDITIQYTEDVGNWESYEYWTTGSPSGVYNAYCIYPQKTNNAGTTASGGKYYNNVKDITGIYGSLQYFLYYSYNAPGWDDVIYTGPNMPSGSALNDVYTVYYKMCNKYGHGSGTGINKCTSEDFYVSSHNLLSYIAYMGNIEGHGRTSLGGDGRWASITTGGFLSDDYYEYIRDDLYNYIGRHNDASQTNFYVYYIENNNYAQDYIYWRDTPEEETPVNAHIEFSKSFSDTSGTFDDTETYHYKYKVYGPNGGYIEEVLTNNSGRVIYPSNGADTLTIGDSYTFCEVTENGYAVVFNSSGTRHGLSDFQPDSSDGCNSYTVGSSYSSNDFVNNRIRKYCARVNKTETGNNDPVDGATFKLYTNSSCNGNGIDASSVSSNTSTFKDLEDTEYWVKETTTPTGYAAPSGNNCAPIETLLQQDSNGTCPSGGSTTVSNAPLYLSFYKENENGDPFTSASFKVKNASGTYITVSARNSHYNNCYVYTGTSSEGTTMYPDSSEGKICIVKIPNGTYSAHEQSTGNEGYYFENGTIENLKPDTDVKGKEATNTLINKPYVLNFYKETEIGSKGDGAEFKILYNNTEIGHSGTEIYTSPNGTTKKCYIYSSASNANKTFISGENGYPGEVCIVRIPGNKEYTIKEIVPPEYHTLGNFDSIDDISPSENFAPNTTGTKFVNYPTEFIFNKEVTGTREKGIDVSSSDKKVMVNGQEMYLSDITTEELKKITFSITKVNSTEKLLFVKTETDGVYQFMQEGIAYGDINEDGVVNDSDITMLNAYLSNPSSVNVSATGKRNIDINRDKNIDNHDLLLLRRHVAYGNVIGVTDLTVGAGDDGRQIKIYHLPTGTYEINENNAGTCENPTDYTKCIGYYDQRVVQRFTITKCSNSRAAATSCTTRGPATATITNRPTEIIFTKSDLYKYVETSDVVKFENEEELKAFDDITFKVKDENGNYLTLKYIGKGGSGQCTNADIDYSIYRYVAGDNSDGSAGTELHACGGHIVITNLCRGKKYYIEEVKVPENSVFVLPTEHPTIDYTIPCTEGDETTSETQTKLINDKPTRVVFQKRDSKYGYLINDETTTFEVYRCKKGVNECHPSEDKSNAVLVKFSERAEIEGDAEDAHKQVYKFLTTTGGQESSGGETELHPYNGELILRYLPGGFTYVLLETVPPKNYTLPSGQNAETLFTIDLSTVDVDEIDVPNKPTSLLIRKYNEDGKELLEGAEFEIYEGTTCDPNLSPMAQPKELLSFKTITDGIYEYRRNFDTNRIRTCTNTVDGKCNGMTSTLTFEDYQNTWVDFTKSKNQNQQPVSIKAGEALIQYLEYGHCYIIKEVKAPKGYSLPEKEEDRYIMVTIEKENDVVDTFKELINKPTPYTFYKFDEHNELIDGAEFKLQKLNSDKVYEDVTVTKETDGTDRTFYKVDEKSTNKVITTKNGTATIYFLEEGQYRIVETKAAPGKELPAKQLNVATFFVDKDGKVTGSAIITNKPKTEKIEVKPKAEAELIVNISTGQQVIRYGLIIGVIVLAISGLLIVQNKSKKKDK